MLAALTGSAADPSAGDSSGDGHPALGRRAVGLAFAMASPAFFALMNVVDAHVIATRVAHTPAYVVVVGLVDAALAAALALLARPWATSAEFSAEFSAEGSLGTGCACAASAGLAIGLATLFYFGALEGDDVSVVVGLEYVYPLAVLALSYAVLREGVGPVGLAGVAVTCAGAVAMSADLSALLLPLCGGARARGAEHEERRPLLAGRGGCAASSGAPQPSPGERNDGEGPRERTPLLSEAGGSEHAGHEGCRPSGALGEDSGALQPSCVQGGEGGGPSGCAQPAGEPCEGRSPGETPGDEHGALQPSWGLRDEEQKQGGRRALLSDASGSVQMPDEQHEGRGLCGMPASSSCAGGSASGEQSAAHRPSTARTLLLVVPLVATVAANEFLLKVATNNIAPLLANALNVGAMSAVLLGAAVLPGARRHLASELRANCGWALLSEALTQMAAVTLVQAMARLEAPLVSSLAAAQPMYVLGLETALRMARRSGGVWAVLVGKALPVALIVAGVVMISLAALD
eukprot:m51a1_g9771 hypothetical protein (519) ;mRNA; r:1656076-1657632